MIYKNHKPKEKPTDSGVTEQPFVLLHIPHSSEFIPPDLREKILLSDEELSAELLRMTDHFTDKLFRCDMEVTKTIIYPVSRLVVDPERFLDDSSEQMAQIAMGAVYTKTSDGRGLRKPPSKEEGQELVRRFYEPQPAAMEQVARSSLSRWGSCLIIDCHSFPAVPLPL
jgi:N-formylglutamate amidohydrolase